MCKMNMCQINNMPQHDFLISKLIKSTKHLFSASDVNPLFPLSYTCTYLQYFYNTVHAGGHLFSFSYIELVFSRICWRILPKFGEHTSFADRHAFHHRHLLLSFLFVAILIPSHECGVTRWIVTRDVFGASDQSKLKLSQSVHAGVLYLTVEHIIIKAHNMSVRHNIAAHGKTKKKSYNTLFLMFFKNILKLLLLFETFLFIYKTKNICSLF